MAKRIPGFPPHWEQFLLCLVFHLSLPLLPIALELWQKKAVSDASMTMGVAMYAIAIGGSSRSRLMFGCMVFVTIVYSIAFGLSGARDGTVENGALNSVSNLGAGWAFAVIYAVHVLERYNKHIADRQPFWEF